MILRFVAVLLLLSNLVSGCAFYPGFDQLPNPDLYYISLGEVVGGVKCAMYSFLYEREIYQGGDSGSLDHKRFELDHTQLASLELVLNTTNTGSLSYSKIDVGAINSEFGINSAASILAVGNSTTGLPFPSVTGTAKGTNIVDLTLTMAQTVEKPDQVLRDKNTGQILRNKKGQTLSDKAADFPDAEDPKYAAFKTRCGAPNENGTVVDYIGLKNWLTHLVSQEEAAIWDGAPEVYLDNVVLTTSFDINVNATAGVNHVLTLVPLIGVPTVGVIPDHSHQLKITLHGYKNTPSPVTSQTSAAAAEKKNLSNLKQQCQKDSGGPCNKPEDLLLEKIVQSSGQKKS
jgi:hypothetical protein